MQPTAPDAATEHDSHHRELRKEAYAMALYVAVCVLAALLAITDTDGHGQVAVVGIVWGTTIGLALAHLFAFRLSARLVGSGEVADTDGQIAIAQLAGAAIVALLCTIPIIVFPASAELDAVRLALAVFIAVVGFGVATAAGATRTRSTVYAGIVLVAALAIALAKNLLSGH